MKPPFIFLAFVALHLHATPITASFDSLAPNTTVSSGYTENGITFTTPSQFYVATGTWAAVLFGWGGYSYIGNALSVHDQGWVGIETGALMDSVTLKYGFDWNGYSIEYGTLIVSLDWRFILNGNVVDQGTRQLSRDHGGSTLTMDSAMDFDQLLVRSTSNLYGDANHIAFDDVRIILAEAPQQAFAQSVPDAGAAWALGIMAALAVGVWRRVFV